MRIVRVHLTPALFEPQELKGGTAVVIDVLRATTTMIRALDAGAARVIPCGEVDEARATAASLPAGSALLGGERGGLIISGFDLGNSPDEYRPEAVAGRTLVFTTTNGTRALSRARAARRVYLGALSNLTAVAGRLAAESGPVHLVCAGTDGRVTLEDVLCAGLIASALRQRDADFDFSDDGTALALRLSDSAGGDYDAVHALVRSSRGGRNLIEHGLDADIRECARRDTTTRVPELSRAPWQIAASEAGAGDIAPHG